MATLETSFSQAQNLADVLTGKLDSSYLGIMDTILKDNDSFRWSCLMTQAVLRGDPIKVFQLGGSHHFVDPHQNRIALILMECATGMLSEKGIPARQSSTETNNENEVIKSAQAKKVKRKAKRKQVNFFDLRFHLSHNLRQAVSRHLRRHENKISDDAIRNYAEQYKENEQSLKDFCEHMRSRYNGTE